MQVVIRCVSLYNEFIAQLELRYLKAFKKKEDSYSNANRGVGVQAQNRPFSGRPNFQKSHIMLQKAGAG